MSTNDDPGVRAPWTQALVTLVASMGVVLALHPRIDDPVARIAGTVAGLAAAAVLWSDRYRGPFDGVAVLFPCMGFGVAASKRWIGDGSWTEMLVFWFVTATAYVVVGWRLHRRTRRRGDTA